MNRNTVERLGSGLPIASAVLAVFIAYAGLPAVAAADEPAPSDGAVATINAAELWAKNCKSCHGDDGRGNTKAGKMKKVKDLTAADVRTGFDRERMIASVTGGINDEAGKSLMKAYADKLSAAEIAALVDYVIALPH